MAPTHAGTAGASGVELSGRGYGASPAVGSPANGQNRLVGYIVRLLAIVFTFIAVIVMGVAKQSFKDFQITIKSTQSSSLVYFIVANVFVCVYSAVTAGVSFINPSSSTIELILGISDLLALGFLFTANAAAMAVDVLARKGNLHYDWDKICGIADKFCSKVTAAIVFSSFTAVSYLVLLVLFIIVLHKRSV